MRGGTLGWQQPRTDPRLFKTQSKQSWNPIWGPQQARPPRILFTSDEFSSLRFFSAELRDFQSPTAMLTTALEQPGGAEFLLSVPRTKAKSGSLSAGAEGEAREGSASHECVQCGCMGIVAGTETNWNSDHAPPLCPATLPSEDATSMSNFAATSQMTALPWGQARAPDRNHRQ